MKIKGDLAIDSESMGLNIKRDRLCVIQLSNGDGNAHLVEFKPGKYDAPNLRKLLLQKSVVKIFHYARFDLAMIYQFLGIKLENIYCTKVASKLARTYTEYHGLKDLCRELLNIQISKHQQSSYWGSKELSNDQVNYAASDVLYLHQLRDSLNNMLEREGRLHLALKCFAFLPTRIELDVEGWNDIDIFAYKS